MIIEDNFCSGKFLIESMKYVDLRDRSSSPFSKWHRFVHGVQFYLVNTGLLKSAAKHEGCYAKTSSLFSQTSVLYKEYNDWFAYIVNKYTY